MTKLSKDDYWDHLYASRKGFPLWVFPKGDYADYLLWENVLKRYFSGIKGGKVLEIGSAPGEFLIQLSRRFDLAPYGVEITSHGAELNRSIFKSNNIDPNQVTQADFLSSDFQSKNQCAFDVVLSRGVIEHFTNVVEVIDKHINLLVPGGLLLVSIPHLRGFNYFLARMFNRETLAIHNLEIMDKKVFSQLFERKNIQSLFCDYYGTFSFSLFNARSCSPVYILLVFCWCLQWILNGVFKLLFGDKGKESSYFSPYLIFIGRKL